jgi:hypothetical protein
MWLDLFYWSHFLLADKLMLPCWKILNGHFVQLRKKKWSFHLYWTPLVKFIMRREMVFISSPTEHRQVPNETRTVRTALTTDDTTTHTRLTNTVKIGSTKRNLVQIRNLKSRQAPPQVYALLRWSGHHTKSIRLAVLRWLDLRLSSMHDDPDDVFFTRVRCKYEKPSEPLLGLMVMSHWLDEVWIWIRDSFVLFFLYLCFVRRVAFACLMVCRW